MRLIDVDETYKVLTEYYRQRTEIQHEALKEAIERVPTIEAEPVRHGRWVKPNPKGIVSYDEHAYAECSVCHTAEYLGYGMAYCPTCGAKMDTGNNT